ncbi:MAG: DNA polymerase II [Candidatus Woesearchaeota archaeon]|nr:DNA polymerase II [Candidatus Woesearchaeota archaeon]
MKGYIVDETYRIEHGKAHVYLFGKLENGKSFCSIHYFRPYFCIKQADVTTAKNLPTTIAYESEATDLQSMQGEPLAKIIYDIPKDTVALRKIFEENKIQCYEADIRFTQRFLIDNNILRTVDIEGAYEEHDYVNRVYKEPQLTPIDWQPELKVLSFDIETSMDAKKLYSISLIVPGEINEVLIITEKTDLQHAKIFPDEKSLLEHFRKEVIRLDPDIMTGWNTIDFDLNVLRKKFREHNIPFKMARQDWECLLRIESSFLKESTADFPGRQVFDGIQLLKLNFVSLENYKLATAAKTLLGDDKLIGEDNKGHSIDDAYKNDTQKLVNYNLKDSQLVLDIMEKTNVSAIMITRSMLTGMNLSRVKGSIASFDSLYLRELKKQGYIANCTGYSERDERISGGYVMEGKPGIYDNIIVCDFKSLYPSIMRTFNIDPLAYERGKTNGGIKAPNDVVFEDGNGILPKLLEEFWQARDAAKKRNDPIASFAIKILMNSFFGVLASPACRFYSLDVGNAITSFARHFTQMTATKVEEMGYEVIYGDTDSVFINAHAKTEEEAQQIGNEVTEKINAYYNEHVQAEYGRKSFLELEAEKVFVNFIMPKIRGSEQGAKKRYAGIVMKNGKEDLQVTGMEIVRRDWTELAKQFQGKILQLVFKKNDPSAYIKEFVDDVREGKRDELLVYKKSIRKDLASYTKTTPPHVKAARLLEEKGKLESNVIEYVMTPDGPYPTALEPKTIDYDHYIEKQLKPIADAILVFFDTTFDDVLKGSKQMTLGGF